MNLHFDPQQLRTTLLIWINARWRAFQSDYSIGLGLKRAQCDLPDGADASDLFQRFEAPRREIKPSSGGQTVFENSNCKTIPGARIRVLLIEDDKELSQRLRDTLTTSGFATDLAADGETGCHMGETTVYDAIVLDLGLPLLSGLDILKRWRAAGRNMPVLILTARSGWVERVNGLNAGADDYLEKPFQAAEVVARLHALIRRATGNASAQLKHKDIEVDPSTGAVTRSGQPVELTAQELRVLVYFMQRPERIVSQNDLLDHVYNADQPRDRNTIEVYVGRLRKKLGADLIKTIRGMGYRLG